MRKASTKPKGSFSRSDLDKGPQHETQLLTRENQRLCPNREDPMKFVDCEKKENNEPNEKKYIQKEYNYAAFKRTFALPQDVNKNKIDAL